MPSTVGWQHEGLPFATSTIIELCAQVSRKSSTAKARPARPRHRGPHWEQTDGCSPRALNRTREAIRAAVPSTRYNPVARTLCAGAPAPAGRPPVLVITAGTSDLPVAEEAIETLRAVGEPVEALVDVGVAGVHRLMAQQEALGRAGVVIVVAGMEGALASVVGGLVRVPVVAVPTSVGYGASFGGLAALLGMLTTCAAGVVVVNIDNGFGGGFAAARINACGARRRRRGDGSRIRSERGRDAIA